MHKQQISIFVIDDCEVIRLGICAALQQEQAFKVIGISGSLKEASTQIDQLQPDVILLETRDLASIEEIRAKHTKTKVLVMGSDDDALKIREAFAAGADGYCTKGVRTDWLQGGIKMIHAGGRWASPNAVEALLDASKLVPAETRFTAKQRATNGALSAREQEVLNLLVQGYSNTEIGSRLFLSPETIKTHVRHIMEKLSVRDRTHAAVEAVRRGLVPAC